MAAAEVMVGVLCLTHMVGEAQRKITEGGKKLSGLYLVGNPLHHYSVLSSLRHLVPGTVCTTGTGCFGFKGGQLVVKHVNHACSGTTKMGRANAIFGGHPP